MVAVAKGSYRIGKFMREIFSNIGKIMVEIGLVVGFTLVGLVAIILTAICGLGKIRRWWNER